MPPTLMPLGMQAEQCCQRPPLRRFGANLLTSDAPTVDRPFYEMLREHFSDGQILELGSALAVASGWQTFIEAFGIRPDGQWLEGVR